MNNRMCLNFKFKNNGILNRLKSIDEKYYEKHFNSKNMKNKNFLF